MNAGDLYYFDKFFFKNGAPPAAKFFLVIHGEDTSRLVVSLPSSQDYIPATFDGQYGCIQDESSGIGCFVIQPGVEICPDGFAFELRTIIYLDYLDEYDLGILQDQYVREVDYKWKGRINYELYRHLIECILSSDKTKRKYKNRIGETEIEPW